MNRYRTTLFALALALPGPAWSRSSTQQEACDSLKTLAARVLGDQKLDCRPQGEKLAVEGPEDAFQQVRAAAFPHDRYQEFPVVRRDDSPVAPLTSPAAAERILALGPTFEGLTPDVNFDGDFAPSGSFLLAGGPPGSQPSGPPGSKPQAPSVPPGSRPGTNPPGSRPGNGNDAPPSSGLPPSRPTPVFIPQAPPPNYWNTVDWGTVPIWANLPSDWEQNEFDEQNGRYVTRWYRYSQPFVSDYWTKDAQAVTRRMGVDDVSFGLVSRQVFETKECYYQGVYNLDWNSFEGRYDGRFSHYRAACRRSESYGGAERRNIRVHFDMQGRSLLPWETEVVRASFDGRSAGVGVESSAFQYSRSSMGDAVYFRAEAKLRTAPDADGVTAELVPDGQTLKLRVFDKWAGYYAGETLEVAVKLMYVTPGWFTKNVPADVRAYAQGNQIRWTPLVPPGAPGSGGGFNETLKTDEVQAKGCRTYYIESWSFRRANNAQPDNMSLISSSGVVQKGASKRIKLCP